MQALAAALGGVQSMALSCFDEAIAIPTTACADAGAAHAADAAARVRHHRRRRPARRIVVRRAADRPAGGRGAGPDGRGRAHRRRGRRDRAGLLPAADRRRGLRARSSGSRRARTWWSASTRSSTRRRRRRSGSTSRRSWSGSQREKLERPRADREQRGCRGAVWPSWPRRPRGTGDLMPPLLAAVRADATVGEICGDAARRCSASTAPLSRCRSESLRRYLTWTNRFALICSRPRSTRPGRRRGA